MTTPTIGTARGVALYVAAVAGPGLLTLPAVATAIAGPVAVVAVAGLVAISGGVAATFVALERRAGWKGGGVVQYTHLAFGPVIAHVVRAWFVLGVPVGVPALGMIAGEYLAGLTGGGRSTVVVTSVVLTVLALVSCISPRGPVDVLNVPLTILLSAVVVVAVTATSTRWDLTHLHPVAPNGWAAVVPAALVLAWLLTGWEAAANFAGSLRDPARTVRRVTLGAIAVVGALFLSLTIAQLLVLGSRPGPSPVAAMLSLPFGAAGLLTAVVLAVTVALNNAAAYTFSLTLVARPITGSHRRALTLVASVMALTLLVVSVTGASVQTVVTVCAASQLPVYLTVLLAAARRLPHGATRWIAWATALCVGGLLASAGRTLVVPATIAVGALAFARHSRHTTPSSDPRSTHGADQPAV